MEYKIGQKVNHKELGKGEIIQKYNLGKISFVDIRLNKFRITKDGIKTNVFRYYYKKNKEWK